MDLVMKTMHQIKAEFFQMRCNMTHLVQSENNVEYGILDQFF